MQIDVRTKRILWMSAGGLCLLVIGFFVTLGFQTIALFFVGTQAVSFGVQSAQQKEPMLTRSERRLQMEAILGEDFDEELEVSSGVFKISDE